ncbi:MarR family transcriptional regulator [Paenibacillus sp. J31TS4]|uniref:MarR family winged helix-turn-helix transcriptional regulator n=1 Tax=Paenibacillus sp. J31TS4 TaxID=2807195 RepID=UPI001B27AE72|nr:MarR family transcriptional regulator [Paenibacillus sp. J31TS4]GIP40374.1 MarR family transcriptional regulator [Paenibacillus sp. J31TS4]
MTLTNKDTYSQRFQMALFTLLKRIGPEQHANLGVTGPQFYILMCLHREGSCKASRLAELMEVKPSAITVMIDRLVSHGLVIREADEQDRRVVLIGLTEKGRQVLEQVKEKREEIVTQHLSCLEPDELHAFIQSFEKVAQTAQATKQGAPRETC